MKNISYIKWGASALIISVVGTPAYAREDTSTGDNIFEEIVVTASKRGAQSLQDIPNNISALGAQQLEQIKAEGIDDIARHVAGLEIQDGGPANKRIQIRGLSGNAQVSVYMDEIPFLSNIGANVAQTDILPFDLNRVEVLRGPQGTLYGGGSQGGTIRYITNKPDYDDFAGSVRGDIGLRSRGAGEKFALDGMLNIPVVAGKMALRIVGFYKNIGGYVDLPELGSAGEADTNTQKNYGGRALLSIQLGEKTDFLATAIYQRSDVGDSSFVTEGSDSRGGPIKEPFFDDLTMYNATINHEFSTGTLTATGSYFRREALFVFDVSQFVGGTPASVNQKGPENGYSGEVRFASNLDGPVQFIVGGFYQRHKAAAISQAFFLDPETGLVPDNPVSFFDTRINRRNTNKSLFGEITYEATEKLSLVGGLRVFRMDTWSQASVVISPFGPAGVEDPRPSETGTKIAAKAQAFYKWSDDLLTYLTFSQGFRRGGANNPALTAGGVPVSSTFDPDYVDNFEFGWKTQLMDRQLTFNGAVYYMRFKDIQTGLLSDNGALGYTTNSGTANLYGLELETIIRPRNMEGFSLSMNMTLADQKLAEDAVDAGINLVAGLSGERLPGTSSFSAGAIIEQRFEIADYDAHANISASYNGTAQTHFSDRALDGAGAPMNRTYGNFVLMNAQFGIEGEGWRASLYAKNLFNKRVPLGWRVEVNPGIPDRIITTQPRVIGVSVGLDF